MAAEVGASAAAQQQIALPPEGADITNIQDEDLLRRMWQATEDFGRKKEIRARMYKLREQRLKEFYTTGEVLSDLMSTTLDSSTNAAESSANNAGVSSTIVTTRRTTYAASESGDSVGGGGLVVTTTETIRGGGGSQESLIIRYRSGGNEEENLKNIEMDRRQLQDSTELIYETGGKTTRSSRSAMSSSNNQSSSMITKSANYGIHSQSLADQGFLTMKSKEIRDSESPTRDFSHMHSRPLQQTSSMTRGGPVGGGGYWYEESRTYHTGDDGMDVAQFGTQGGQQGYTSSSVIEYGDGGTTTLRTGETAVTSDHRENKTSSIKKEESSMQKEHSASSSFSFSSSSKSTQDWVQRHQDDESFVCENTQPLPIETVRGVGYEERIVREKGSADETASIHRDQVLKTERVTEKTENDTRISKDETECRSTTTEKVEKVEGIETREEPRGPKQRITQRSKTGELPLEVNITKQVTTEVITSVPSTAASTPLPDSGPTPDVGSWTVVSGKQNGVCSSTDEFVFRSGTTTTSNTAKDASQKIISSETTTREDTTTFEAPRTTPALSPTSGKPTPSMPAAGKPTSVDSPVTSPSVEVRSIMKQTITTTTSTPQAPSPSGYYIQTKRISTEVSPTHDAFARSLRASPEKSQTCTRASSKTSIDTNTTILSSPTRPQRTSVTSPTGQSSSPDRGSSRPRDRSSPMKQQTPSPSASKEKRKLSSSLSKGVGGKRTATPGASPSASPVRGRSPCTDDDVPRKPAGASPERKRSSAAREGSPFSEQPSRKSPGKESTPSSRKTPEKSPAREIHKDTDSPQDTAKVPRKTSDATTTKETKTITTTTTGRRPSKGPKDEKPVGRKVNTDRLSSPASIPIKEKAPEIPKESKPSEERTSPTSPQRPKDLDLKSRPTTGSKQTTPSSPLDKTPTKPKEQDKPIDGDKRRPSKDSPIRQKPSNIDKETPKPQPIVRADQPEDEFEVVCEAPETFDVTIVIPIVPSVEYPTEEPGKKYPAKKTPTEDVVSTDDAQIKKIVQELEIERIKRPSTIPDQTPSDEKDSPYQPKEKSPIGDAPRKTPSFKPSPEKDTDIPGKPKDGEEPFERKRPESPEMRPTRKDSQPKKSPAKESPDRKPTEEYGLPKKEPTRDSPSGDVQRKTSPSPSRNAPETDSPSRRSPARDYPSMGIARKDSPSPVREESKSFSPSRRSPIRDSPVRDYQRKQSPSPSRDEPLSRSPSRKSPARASPKRDVPKSDSPTRSSPYKCSPSKDSPRKSSPSPIRDTLRKKSQSPARDTTPSDSPSRRSPIRDSPKKKSPSPAREVPKSYSPSRQSPARGSPARESPRKHSPSPTKDTPKTYSPTRKASVRDSPKDSLQARSPARKSPSKEYTCRDSPRKHSPSPVKDSPTRKSPERKPSLRDSPRKHSPSPARDYPSSRSVGKSPQRDSVRKSPSRDAPTKPLSERESPYRRQPDDRTCPDRSSARKPSIKDSPRKESPARKTPERDTTRKSPARQSPLKESPRKTPEREMPKKIPTGTTPTKDVPKRASPARKPFDTEGAKKPTLTRKSSEKEKIIPKKDTVARRSQSTEIPASKRVSPFKDSPKLDDAPHKRPNTTESPTRKSPSKDAPARRIPQYTSPARQPTDSPRKDSPLTDSPVVESPTAEKPWRQPSFKSPTKETPTTEGLAKTPVKDYPLSGIPRTMSPSRRPQTSDSLPSSPDSPRKDRKPHPSTTTEKSPTTQRPSRSPERTGIRKQPEEIPQKPGSKPLSRIPGRTSSSSITPPSPKRQTPTSSIPSYTSPLRRTPKNESSPHPTVDSPKTEPKGTVCRQQPGSRIPESNVRRPGESPVERKPSQTTTATRKPKKLKKKRPFCGTETSEDEEIYTSETDEDESPECVEERVTVMEKQVRRVSEVFVQDMSSPQYPVQNGGIPDRPVSLSLITTATKTVTSGGEMQQTIDSDGKVTTTTYQQPSTITMSVSCKNREFDGKEEFVTRTVKKTSYPDRPDEEEDVEIVEIDDDDVLKPTPAIEYPSDDEPLKRPTREDSSKHAPVTGAPKRFGSPAKPIKKDTRPQTVPTTSRRPISESPSARQPINGEPGKKRMPGTTPSPSPKQPSTGRKFPQASKPGVTAPVSQAPDDKSSPKTQRKPGQISRLPAKQVPKPETKKTTTTTGKTLVQQQQKTTVLSGVSSTTRQQTSYVTSTMQKTQPRQPIKGSPLQPKQLQPAPKGRIPQKTGKGIPLKDTKKRVTNGRVPYSDEPEDEEFTEEEYEDKESLIDSDVEKTERYYTDEETLVEGKVTEILTETKITPKTSDSKPPGLHPSSAVCTPTGIPTTTEIRQVSRESTPDAPGRRPRYADRVSEPDDDELYYEEKGITRITRRDQETIEKKSVDQMERTITVTMPRLETVEQRYEEEEEELDEYERIGVERRRPVRTEQVTDLDEDEPKTGDDDEIEPATLSVASKVSRFLTASATAAAPPQPSQAPKIVEPKGTRRPSWEPEDSSKYPKGDEVDQKTYKTEDVTSFAVKRARDIFETIAKTPSGPETTHSPTTPKIKTGVLGKASMFETKQVEEVHRHRTTQKRRPSFTGSEESLGEEGLPKEKPCTDFTESEEDYDDEPIDQVKESPVRKPLPKETGPAYKPQYEKNRPKESSPGRTFKPQPETPKESSPSRTFKSQVERDTPKESSPGRPLKPTAEKPDSFSPKEKPINRYRDESYDEPSDEEFPEDEKPRKPSICESSPTKPQDTTTPKQTDTDATRRRNVFRDGGAPAEDEQSPKVKKTSVGSTMGREAFLKRMSKFASTEESKTVQTVRDSPKMKPVSKFPSSSSPSERASKPSDDEPCRRMPKDRQSPSRKLPTDSGTRRISREEPYSTRRSPARDIPKSTTDTYTRRPSKDNPRSDLESPRRTPTRETPTQQTESPRRTDTYTRRPSKDHPRSEMESPRRTPTRDTPTQQYESPRRQVDDRSPSTDTYTRRSSRDHPRGDSESPRRTPTRETPTQQRKPLDERRPSTDTTTRRPSRDHPKEGTIQKPIDEKPRGSNTFTRRPSKDRVREDDSPKRPQDGTFTRKPKPSEEDSPRMEHDGFQKGSDTFTRRPSKDRQSPRRDLPMRGPEDDSPRNTGTYTRKTSTDRFKESSPSPRSSPAREIQPKTQRPDESPRRPSQDRPAEERPKGSDTFTRRRSQPKDEEPRKPSSAADALKPYLRTRNQDFPGEDEKKLKPEDKSPKKLSSSRFETFTKRDSTTTVTKDDTKRAFPTGADHTPKKLSGSRFDTFTKRDSATSVKETESVVSRTKTTTTRRSMEREEVTETRGYERERPEYEEPVPLRKGSCTRESPSRTDRRTPERGDGRTPDRTDRRAPDITDRTPDKRAPDRSERRTPDRTDRTPDRRTPERMDRTPDKRASDRTDRAPDRRAPDRSDRRTPDRTDRTPDKRAPDRTDRTPDRRTPDRTDRRATDRTPDRRTPERMDRRLSDRTDRTPDSRAPDRTPDRRTPDRKTPDRREESPVTYGEPARKKPTKEVEDEPVRKASRPEDEDVEPRTSTRRRPSKDSLPQPEEEVPEQQRRRSSGGKFGVVLRQTSSVGSRVEALMSKVEKRSGTTTTTTSTTATLTPTRRRPSKGPDSGLEIEEIFDLEFLEHTLEKATDYDQRRRIRAQIRIVRRGEGRPEPSKEPTRDAPKERPSTLSTKTRPSAPAPDEPDAEYERKGKPRRPSQTRESPEKVTTTPSLIRKPSRAEEVGGELTSPSVVAKLLPSPSSTAGTPSSPASRPSPTPTTSVPKKNSLTSSSGLPREAYPTDSITSSYGVGPTDESGRPLFGLRALRRPQQQAPDGGPSAPAPSPNTQSREASLEPRPQSPETSDVRDSSGRPLFGLRAITISSTSKTTKEGRKVTERPKSPETGDRPSSQSPSEDEEDVEQRREMPSTSTASTTETSVHLRDLVRRHELHARGNVPSQPVAPVQKPRAKLRDSFILNQHSLDDEEEDAVEGGRSPARPVGSEPQTTGTSPGSKTFPSALPSSVAESGKVISERSCTLKSIIQKHEKIADTEQTNDKLNRRDSGLGAYTEEEDMVPAKNNYRNRSQDYSSDEDDEEDYDDEEYQEIENGQRPETTTVKVTSDVVKRPGILKKPKDTDVTESTIAASTTSTIRSQQTVSGKSSGYVSLKKDVIQSVDDSEDAVDDDDEEEIVVASGGKRRAPRTTPGRRSSNDLGEEAPSSRATYSSYTTTSSSSSVARAGEVERRRSSNSTPYRVDEDDGDSNDGIEVIRSPSDSRYAATTTTTVTRRLLSGSESPKVVSTTTTVTRSGGRPEEEEGEVVVQESRSSSTRKKFESPAATPDSPASPSPKTGFSRVARGGSVRALSQKFQQAADAASSGPDSPSRAYPKAGLIFRTASFRQGFQSSPPTTPIHSPSSPCIPLTTAVNGHTGTKTTVGEVVERRTVTSTSARGVATIQKDDASNDYLQQIRRRSVENDRGSSPTSSRRSTEVSTVSSSRTRQPEVDEYDDDDIQGAGETVTVEQRTVVVTNGSAGSQGRSFLGNQNKVTGVQDVLSRMREADNEGPTEGDTVEDSEARALLNKFLGAQVILQGMEPLINAQSPSLVRQVEKQRVQKKQESTSVSVVYSPDLDLDGIWDERRLRHLLDSCTDYDGRRKIRARIRTVMAEQKVTAAVVAEGRLEAERESQESSGRSKAIVSKQSDDAELETSTTVLRSVQGHSEATSMSSSTESSVTKTEVHTKTSNYSATVTGKSRVSKATPSKVMSPFAKFKQLDEQNAGSAPNSPKSPGGTGPLFKFTDPQLSRSASGVKDRLLYWCQIKTKEYKNIQIENFSTSWSNGLAFCALIHHFCPEAFDYDNLRPEERRKNFELAFRVADDKAGIAPLLDVEDMVVMRKPDWKCVFTYVQSIYRRFKDED